MDKKLLFLLHFYCNIGDNFRILLTKKKQFVILNIVEVGEKMKSNQKGFTLIELLAVIVILAIIALIATPIVLNIINKAKKSAAADSVYGTMEAIKLAYTESLLDTTAKTLPLEVTCTKSGCDKDVKVSGTSPDGILTLDDEGKFTFKASEGEAATVSVNGIACTIEAATQKVTCGA